MNNILLEARKKQYAVGGFNFNCYEDTLGIVKAAASVQSPVYLMASEGTVNFLGVGYIKQFVDYLKQTYHIPIVLHLDHGKDMKLIQSCIDHSFDSIMFDGSRLPFEENIQITKQVADLCHEKGILVEGELGRISGQEEEVDNPYSLFTNPDTVQEFVERSDVDSLAVSIGNAHGLYKGEPKIHFDLLEKINALSAVPLVLHGGTGIPFNDLDKAIHLGITKINVGTELKISYFNGVKSYLKQYDNLNVRGIFDHITANIQDTVQSYLKRFSEHTLVH